MDRANYAISCRIRCSSAPETARNLEVMEVGVLQDGFQHQLLAEGASEAAVPEHRLRQAAPGLGSIAIRL